jgi:adenylate cyclase
MAHLRDLIGIEQAAEFRLPPWLERIVTAGIVSNNPKVVRRQLIVNVAAFASAFNAVSRVVSLPFYGAEDYWLAQMISGAFAVTSLLIPQMHRFGDNVGAVAITTLFAASASTATMMFGLTAQVQVYCVLAGLIWFLVGLERWRFSVGVILAFAAIALTLLELAPQRGPVVSQESARWIAVQSMLNAIAINGVMLFYALYLLQRAETGLERQTARAEGLLSVVLPPAIADRLRASPDKPIADRIDGATILFADLEGFTEAAHAEPPEAVVAYLDRLMRSFDDSCQECGIEKIKSIGDAYMAAGGLKGDRREGAVAAGRFALSMLQTQETLQPLGKHKLRLRIGIHTGPAIGGVIGGTRISYDLWGDAVNVASRMESQGVPGRIHVSEAFKNAASDAFEFEPRGDSDLRGIGSVPTFFLLRERPRR